MDSGSRSQKGLLVAPGTAEGPADKGGEEETPHQAQDTPPHPVRVLQPQWQWG